jgi:elongation factor G
MMGRETTDVKSVAAGDICVVPKLDAMTGDTLSATGKLRQLLSVSPTRSIALPLSLMRAANEGKFVRLP